MGHTEINKIAFVGDYLPRKCGIATFTHDMYESISKSFPNAEYKRKRVRFGSRISDRRRMSPNLCWNAKEFANFI